MSDFWNLRRTCAQFHRLELSQESRRGFLQAGALGTAGLSLANLLRSEAAAAPAAIESKAKNNVIILWMRGGPSHIDMWDTKPNAPAEFRGEFGTMSTNVSGIQLTDMLPHCAKVMDKWSIIRSLNHGDAGHSTGDQFCFTGYGPGIAPDENVHPSVGSVAAEQLGKLNPRLPAYVMIPRMVPGTGSAYLGVSCKPFETQADPAAVGPFKVQNFEMAAGLSVNRLGDRQNLLTGLDKLRREADASGKMAGLDRFGQKAYDMLCSPEAQKAFDLDAEPQKVRDRYGFMPAFDPGATNRCGSPAWSQRILLARRLVEAGVRLVTVDLRWWDTHVKGFESLKLGFLPRFDLAYSALIQDLHERGLMEKTLVVAWGEFGRTPRVNNDAGRDHYPHVFSAAIAGGKVKGGRVIGASDSHGAFPKDNPKSPLDVLATIYDHLGIDAKKQYLNDAGRPISILPGGEPIKELF
ncbi:MAG: DUF1501 domain-containing protein [Pirellulaceae bacterium]